MSFWTAERVAELKIRWNQAGESAMQICLAMGAVSRNAIISKVHRLGLAVRAVKHANGVRRSNGSRPRARVHTHERRKRLLSVRTDMAYAVDGVVAFKNPKPLLALGRHDCHWPGSGRGADLLFCAAPTVPGYPYCRVHCRIVVIWVVRGTALSAEQPREGNGALAVPGAQYLILR
jgi:GcrA cell cycle regulator